MNLIILYSLTTKAFFKKQHYPVYSSLALREDVKKSDSLGQARNSLTPRPPPRRAKTLMQTSTKKFFLSFFYMQIQNNIKHMILRENIQNNMKSFQIHIFTFQDILHLFLLIEKNLFSCGQGVDPPPVYGHARN